MSDVVADPVQQVVEFRSYRIVPGRADASIEHFESHSRASQAALGMDMVGQFRVVNGENVHVRQADQQLADARRVRLRGGSEGFGGVGTARFSGPLCRARWTPRYRPTPRSDPKRFPNGCQGVVGHWSWGRAESGSRCCRSSVAGVVSA